MTTLSWVLLIVLGSAVVRLLTRGHGSRTFEVKAGNRELAPVRQANDEDAQRKPGHEHHGGCC